MRGYALADFGDSFARYVPSPLKSDFQPGRLVEPNNDAGFDDVQPGMGHSILPSQTRYEKSSPTESKLTNANNEAGPTDLPGRNGKNEGSGEEEEFIDAD